MSQPTSMAGLGVPLSSNNKANPYTVLGGSGGQLAGVTSLNGQSGNLAIVGDTSIGVTAIGSGQLQVSTSGKAQNVAAITCSSVASTGAVTGSAITASGAVNGATMTASGAIAGASASAPLVTTENIRMGVSGGNYQLQYAGSQTIVGAVAGTAYNIYLENSGFVALTGLFTFWAQSANGNYTSGCFINTYNGTIYVAQPSFTASSSGLTAGAEAGTPGGVRYTVIPTVTGDLKISYKLDLTGV